MCYWPLSARKSTPGRRLATTIKLAADRGAVRPLVRGRVAVTGFENLPMDEDLATNPLGKSLMAIKSIPQSHRPRFCRSSGYAGGSRGDVARRFAEGIKDPELIAEAQKAKIDMQLHFARASDERFHRAAESNA